MWAETKTVVTAKVFEPKSGHFLTRRMRLALQKVVDLQRSFPELINRVLTSAGKYSPQVQSWVWVTPKPKQVGQKPEWKAKTT
jgi:hypothetical protein